MSERKSDFVPLRHAAALFGVPQAWMKSQVESGNIPAIKTGRMWMVHKENARVKLEKMADDPKREE